MFTAEQLVAHAVGDYLLQSHWMATQKTRRDWPALAHAFTYTLPFLLITDSLIALYIIMASHYVIDRHNLARYVVWLKNGPCYSYSWLWTEPKNVEGEWELTIPWKPLTSTGYPSGTPPHLAQWLAIIADNILHVICNAIAIWAYA